MTDQQKDTNRDDYCCLDRPVIRDYGKAPRKDLLSKYWGELANDLPTNDG